MNLKNRGNMALIGYARVSSVQQNLDEQIDALKNYGCEKIFAGKHSGKAKENQEQLDKMLLSNKELIQLKKMMLYQQQ